MIQVNSNLKVDATTLDGEFDTSKRIVVTMCAEDAFALASVLLNLDPINIPVEWQPVWRQLAQNLVDKGNDITPSRV